MNYLMAFTLLLSIQEGITNSFFQHLQEQIFSSPSASISTNDHFNRHHPSNQQSYATECGIRPARRQPRTKHKQQNYQQYNNHRNQHNYYNHQQYYYNQYSHQEEKNKKEKLQQHEQQREQQQQEQQKRKNNKSANNQFFHNARKPKIIAGNPTKEGQFPWQASLELLHPSMGFLGHWCGGVLVDEFWVLSASHCVHNDLFNLPLPPLWTVVLGEYDRNIESGNEQRIPVEKIILHQSYQHFLHDLVLMKLAIPADISKLTNVRKICLPFVFNENDQSFTENDDIIDDVITSNQADEHQSQTMQMTNIFNDNNNQNHHKNNNNKHHFNKNNNNNNNNNNNGNNKEEENFFPSLEDFLLSMQGRNKINFTLPSMKELMTTKIANFLKRPPIKRPSGRHNSKFPKRRNDKFMSGFKNRDNIASTINDDSKKSELLLSDHHRDKIISTGTDTAGDINIGGIGSSVILSKYNKNHHDEYKDLPYVDCIATGWGKLNTTGDLSDILLKTYVPLQSNSRCKDAYGSFVKIHKGHLCAGKLNGKGGTCVGDSGGPLQCRLTKNGPWILAGITSFGSGCALEGYPDVYTRTSFYMKWIRDIIENE